MLFIGAKMFRYIFRISDSGPDNAVAAQADSESALPI
jgi:hypothetical protein